MRENTPAALLHDHLSASSTFDLAPQTYERLSPSWLIQVFKSEVCRR
ncbi:hypothetical protein ABIC02_007337 [Bradyrhizobium sp. RT5a]